MAWPRRRWEVWVRFEEVGEVVKERPMRRFWRTGSAKRYVEEMENDTTIGAAIAGTIAAGKMPLIPHFEMRER